MKLNMSEFKKVSHKHAHAAHSHILSRDKSIRKALKKLNEWRKKMGLTKIKVKNIKPVKVDVSSLVGFPIPTDDHYHD